MTGWTSEGYEFLCPGPIVAPENIGIWHPLGAPYAWSLQRWLSDNVWESEDGPTKLDLCARDSYWDVSMTWLDDTRIAVAGIGDDDADMYAGARVFDVTTSGPAEALITNAFNLDAISLLALLNTRNAQKFIVAA